MDRSLVDLAREVVGFMPETEGLTLYESAVRLAPAGHPFVEIGSYCGRSAVYLGAAARERGTVLYSLDHHRGSEEHQAGEGYHDERFVDPVTGRLDTLPVFRQTVARARLENIVVGIVGPSRVVASVWSTPLALLFIDGGHSATAASDDYAGWSPHLVEGGILAIHDVFPDPADGGRPPFEIYERALRSGRFDEVHVCGSLRVLRRVANRV